MKTYQLTIRPERKGQKLDSKLLAKGEAANATEFYNQHLQKMIEAVKGFDAGVANVSQIGGTESVSTTVYPDDVVSSNATGEQQVEPAGREGREFDPVKGFFDEMVKKNAPDVKINVVDNFTEKCGEAVKNFKGAVARVVNGARHTPCPYVLGDKHCGVDPAGKDCDKSVATCRDKFNNLEHFGGVPDFNIQIPPYISKRDGMMRGMWPGDARDMESFGLHAPKDIVQEHAPYVDRTPPVWDIRRYRMVADQLSIKDMQDPMTAAKNSVREGILRAGHDPDKVRIIETRVEQGPEGHRMVVEYIPNDIYP